MTLTAETTSALADALARVGLELGPPDPGLAGVYVFGASRGHGVDAIGRIAVLLVIGGVVLHGGLRVVLWAIRRQRRVPTLEPRTEGAR